MHGELLAWRGEVQWCAASEIALCEQHASLIPSHACTLTCHDRAGEKKQAKSSQEGPGAAQLKGILEHVWAVLGRLGTVPGP